MTRNQIRQSLKHLSKYSSYFHQNEKQITVHKQNFKWYFYSIPLPRNIDTYLAKQSSNNKMIKK